MLDLECGGVNNTSSWHANQQLFSVVVLTNDVWKISTNKSLEVNSKEIKHFLEKKNCHCQRAATRRLLTVAAPSYHGWIVCFKKLSGF